MKISPGLLRQLEEHARSSAKEEVCGFVYGQEYVPLKNCSRTPWSAFEADPFMVARVLWLREEPDAVFHTHPGGQLHPSQVDKRLAYYNNSTVLIGGWVGEEFQVRAFGS